MQWTPYTGPRRTFVTQLTIDECWRRLHEDVQELSGMRQYFMGNWARLAINDSVVRSINGECFALRIKPAARNEIAWMFEGQFEATPGQTRIVAQHRLSHAAKLNLYSGQAMALIGIIVFSYHGITHRVSLATAILWITLWALLFVVGVVVTARRSADQSHQEAHLVRALQQLFEAEELLARPV